MSCSGCPSCRATSAYHRQPEGPQLPPRLPPRHVPTQRSLNPWTIDSFAACERTCHSHITSAYSQHEECAHRHLDYKRRRGIIPLIETSPSVPNHSILSNPFYRPGQTAGHPQTEVPYWGACQCGDACCRSGSFSRYSNGFNRSLGQRVPPVSSLSFDNTFQFRRDDLNRMSSRIDVSPSPRHDLFAPPYTSCHRCADENLDTSAAAVYSDHVSLSGRRRFGTTLERPHYIQEACRHSPGRRLKAGSESNIPIALSREHPAAELLTKEEVECTHRTERSQSSTSRTYEASQNVQSARKKSPNGLPPSQQKLTKKDMSLSPPKSSSFSSSLSSEDQPASECDVKHIAEDDNIDTIDSCQQKDELEEEPELLSLKAETLSEILGMPMKGYDLSLLRRALLDCYGRFILNLPSSLLSDHVHYHFQVQEAHWWFIDFWLDRYPTELPNITLKAFGILLWDLFPMLQEYIPESARGRLLRDWVDYCRTIPLRGAIILNPNWTKVLLVQGWKGGRWTFPRGKVDEQEADDVCAAREVLEEIGIDISSRMNKDMFIERRIHKQYVKLFIVLGIPEDTPFGPQKRKEISNIKWVSLSSLSSGLYKQRGRLKNNAYRFTHVMQFIKPLINWLTFMYARRFCIDPDSGPEKWTSDLSLQELRRLQAVEAPNELVRDDDSDDEQSTDLRPHPEVVSHDATVPPPPQQEKATPHVSASKNPQRTETTSVKTTVPEETAKTRESPRRSNEEECDSTAEGLLKALIKASEIGDVAEEHTSSFTVGQTKYMPSESTPPKPKSVKSIGVATISSSARLGNVLRRFSRSRDSERRASTADEISVEHKRDEASTSKAVPGRAKTTGSTTSSRIRGMPQIPQLLSRKMKKRITPANGDIDSPMATSSLTSSPEIAPGKPSPTLDTERNLELPQSQKVSGTETNVKPMRPLMILKRPEKV